MISKQQLKDLRRYRMAKYCLADALFTAEGEKVCGELLDSDYEIVAVCALAEWISMHTCKLDSTNCHEVGQRELEMLSTLQTPNKVWMLVRRKSTQPTSWNEPLTLILDHLQDPGNMGTIIRTADWYGVRQIICSRDTVDCYNSKVVQSAMGSLFRTHLHYTVLADWLDRYDGAVYGAVLDGVPIDNTQWKQPAALVIGNESRGIHPDLQKHLTHRITIPNRGGTAESLNAAVATGILLHTLTGHQ